MTSASSRYGALTVGTIALGVCFSVLWSSAFTAARYIILDAPPFMSLALRFLIAGLLGIGIAFAIGQKIDLTRREWQAIVVLGFFQNTVYLGLCFLAVQWVDVSIVVIIASLLPLLIAAAHWVFFGERATMLGVIGLVLGLFGVGMVMANRAAGGIDPIGIVVTLVGVTALAGATLLVGGTFARNKNLLMIVGLQMLIGAITTLPVSLFFEAWEVNWSARLVWAFAWITLVPGLLATLIWFAMLGNLGPTRAAAFHFLNPFFGVAIAAAFLGESLSATDFIGVAVIMAAILAVQLSRQP